MYFAKDGNVVKVSKGDIIPDSEAAENNSFYRRLSDLSNEEMIPVCHKGKPVEVTDERSSKFMSRLIAGVLRTDLGICTKNAKETLNDELVKSN